MYAMHQGIIAARRAFADPSHAEHEIIHQDLVAQYHLRWAYYENKMFDAAVRGWEAYKQKYNLYRDHRPLYNPYKRAVEFHAARLYPGLLSEDGRALPKGARVAIPWSEDTPRLVQLAAGQVWEWSNWQARKSLQVRYAAALGDVLTEVVDDLDTGRVTLELVWPGKVCELALDAAGNVVSYVLQYTTMDQTTKERYLYRKEVDASVFRYFKNGELYDYSGAGAVVENPYGFVPAVWTRFQDMGTDRGAPIMHGTMNKLDDLNDLVSHLLDQVHRVIGAPMVFFGSGPIGNLLAQSKRGQSNHEFDAGTAAALEREKILLWRGPADGKMQPLVGNLDIAAVVPLIDKLLAELEADYPELNYYQELRQMSQVTGPGADILMGDVVSRIEEEQAIFDRANKHAWQMALMIGGFRANSGAWGSRESLSSQQQLFLPFDLDSYRMGDLAMAIMPRPLHAPSQTEQSQERAAFWQSIKAATDAGVPLSVALRDAGWTQQQIAELETAQQANEQNKLASIQRQQQLAQEDVIPAQPQ